VIETFPKPGDLIVATRSMRAWVDINKRGQEGEWIMNGTMAIVIGSWLVGKWQVRLYVLANNKLLIFSHDIGALLINWIQI
jgi:hypothetical protein